MTLDPNDARLTAYALGELDAREAALVEAELGQSPEAARALVEIRQTAELIRQALRAEPASAALANAASSDAALSDAAPAELSAAARARIYAAADGTNGQHAASRQHPIAPRQRPLAPRERLSGWLRQNKAPVSILAVALCVVGAMLLSLQPGRPTAHLTRSEMAKTHAPEGQIGGAIPPGSKSGEYPEADVQNQALNMYTVPTGLPAILPPGTANSNSGKLPEMLGVPVGQAPQSAPALNVPAEFSDSPPTTKQEMRGHAVSLGKNGDEYSHGGQKSSNQQVGQSSDRKQSGNQSGDRDGDGGKGNQGKPSEGSSGQIDSASSNQQQQKQSHSDKPVGQKSGEQNRGLNLGVPVVGDYAAALGSQQGGEEARGEKLAARPNGWYREKNEKNGSPQNFDLDFTQQHNAEDYAPITENAFQAVGEQPLSTFSIDVDTASYSNVRRFLNQGALPPPAAVRIEELVNYFHYSYAPPKEDAADPFAAHADVVDCPWAPKHRLVRIGIKGREIAADKRPACNLVFLLDVSGSMNQANKLPLVKEGLRMLVEKLGENDSVAIVVYAGASGLVLPSTNGTQKGTIMAAIDKLQPGGSTNGASGIQLAYETAVGSFIKGGANRVILATDGDFNVGVTDQGQLVNLIEQKAKSGVFLSVLGFGMGNLKDSTLEKLSDKGNGNYAYIDSQAEARKVLVEQLSGTLVTIAKDVKIQIEFNPAKVLAYRLIGYENRMLAKEDFNDDKKDAGEIGAGHTVTALYEVVPVGVQVATTAPDVDPLEYQDPPPAEAKPAEPKPAAEAPAGARPKSQDLLMLKLRYKAPDGDTSKLLKYPVVDNTQSIGAAGKDCELAAAVAAFGMQLRNSAYKGTVNYAMILELAESGAGEDKEGYRREFVDLVKKAQAVGR